MWTGAISRSLYLPHFNLEATLSKIFFFRTRLMGPLINVKWSVEKSYGGACLALSAYPQNFDKRKNFYSGGRVFEESMR